MGLVKYGAGIAQISGAVGGDVHARNRFGNYIRPRTKPVNPHSARQESIRAILSYIAEYWHTTLTPLQRSAWEIYAAAVAMKNRLGETIYLTGYNHFIRTNTVQLHIGEAIIAAAPVILSLPEKDPDLVCSEETIAAQTFTFTCDNTGWIPNGDPKFAILLSQGLPRLPSRNQFNGPWRYMDIIDATEGAAGTGTYDASFTFGLTQKVWFQARIITDSGRVSEPWTVDPRIIEADPQALIWVTSSGPLGNIDTLYEVTGALTPDATGLFTEYGDYNGERYYRHSTGGFFIWWNGSNTWMISVLLGVVGAGYWKRVDPAIVGPYVAMGTAVGVPTVAAAQFMVAYRIKNMMPGMIMLWYGTYATIPSGWNACDGTNGTPNLQLKYVRGAKVAGPGSGQGIEGGSFTHDHDFTGDGHSHDIAVGNVIVDNDPAGDYAHATDPSPCSGTTDAVNHEPPYMTLFYIMKLPIP